MRPQSGISRRHMLAMSAAATGIAIGGSAAAQSGKRIERFAPELDDIVSTSEPIRELATGTGGPGGPTEGPVWWKEGGFLLYSDIYNDRRMKYEPAQGATVVKEKTNHANGMTRDLQGRLVACERDTRRVTRHESDGNITVIANSFQGKRLNITNDVIVKSDGAIYFTDPKRNTAPEPWDVPHTGVYRVSPDLGTVTLLVAISSSPMGSRSRRMKRSSTLPTGCAAILGPSMLRRTARWRCTPTESSPTCADRSPARPMG